MNSGNSEAINRTESPRSRGAGTRRLQTENTDAINRSDLCTRDINRTTYSAGTHVPSTEAGSCPVDMPWGSGPMQSVPDVTSGVSDAALSGEAQENDNNK